MIPAFNKVHNKFQLNGIHYTYTGLEEVAYSLVKEGEEFEKSIGNFLLDWLDNKSYIKVKTSGSTGLPKTIKLQKQHMVNSAIATGDFFNISVGNTALLCLPGHYIAGKMMLIRAIVLGLKLDYVKPSSNPLFSVTKKYDFCAMTPLQAENSIKKLPQIKKLIVGGAPMSPQLKEALKNIPTQVFETYGMTETITHIAVKKVGNTTFTVLPNVSTSQDKRGCLVIEAPMVSSTKIITNDVVKLHSPTEFEWLGRADNVINSGGVKLFPEQIEAQLANIIPHRFFIASEPDASLGERLIIVIEANKQELSSSVFSVLDKYQKPKAIYFMPRFVETDSGKIQRTKTLKKLQLT